MLNNKNKIILIAVSTVMVIATAFGTVMVLKLSRNTNTTQTHSAVKLEADSLTNQAMKSSYNDPVAARALLQQALQKYKSINDSEGIAITKAQLYRIEH